MVGRGWKRQIWVKWCKTLAFRLRNLGSIPLALRREFGSLHVMWTEPEVCPVTCGILRVWEMPSFAARHMGASVAAGVLPVLLLPSCTTYTKNTGFPFPPLVGPRVVLGWGRHTGSSVEQSFTGLYVVFLGINNYVAACVYVSRTSSLHRGQAGEGSSCVHFFCCGDLGGCHLELEFLFCN